MKLILTILLLLLSPLRSHAGWLENKEQEQRIQQQEQQLAQQWSATGAWQLIAGVASIGAVVLFTIGTALGSTIRRHGKPK